LLEAYDVQTKESHFKQTVHKIFVIYIISPSLIFLNVPLGEENEI